MFRSLLKITASVLALRQSFSRGIIESFRFAFKRGDYVDSYNVFSATEWLLDTDKTKAQAQVGQVKDLVLNTSRKCVPQYKVAHYKYLFSFLSRLKTGLK